MRNIRLFTVMGIPIEINLSWFALLLLIAFSLAGEYFPSAVPGISPFWSWVIGIITALLLFTCLLLHELAHSYVAIKNDLPIKSITLFIFGGVARMEKEPATPEIEFKMAAAGPALSLALALIFWLFAQIAYNLFFNPSLMAVLSYLIIINLAVAVFNLIPGFPLDGGRILRAALWHFGHDFKRATLLASTFGKVAAYLIMAVGVGFFFVGALLSGIWFLLIGFFLEEASSMSYRQVAVKSALSHEPVKAVMSQAAVVIGAELSLENAVHDFFLRYRHHAFPVVANNQIVGLINLDDIKGIDKARWATTSVSSTMQPISQEMIISEDAPALSALYQLNNNGLDLLLVLKSGQLIGVISHRDLTKLLEVKEQLKT